MQIQIPNQKFEHFNKRSTKIKYVRNAFKTLNKGLIYVNLKTFYSIHEKKKLEKDNHKT